MVKLRDITMEASWCAGDSLWTMLARSPLVAISGTALALLVLVWLGARPYGGNVSVFLHMDVPFGREHRVPGGVVLYEDAAYDGMLYYQVARDLPALFSGVPPSLDSPYRFQRILLPLVAYAFAFGNERALPYSLLFLNLAAAIGALGLVLSMTKGRILHAMTIVANPAMLVGILFSLTEPLSLFFVVFFLWFWERNDRKITVASIGALTLSLLARETTVFLIGLLFLWHLWHKQWKETLLVLTPLLPFSLWQGFLALRLGALAFQANSNIVSLPLSGPFTLLQWSLQGLSAYRLSALSLLLFLLSLCIILGREWGAKKGEVEVFCFLLSGLTLTMLIMDAHIWGVITSIGRVVTPVYPVYALYTAARDGWPERLLSAILIALSVVTALGIASTQHPFVLS